MSLLRMLQVQILPDATAPGSPSTVSVSEACSTATDSVVNSPSILTAPVMSLSSSHATEPVVSAAPTDSGKSANTDDIQQRPPLLSFKCDQYDFVGASDKGLKQHTRMKHQISQVDGNDSDLEECNSLQVGPDRVRVISGE